MNELLYALNMAISNLSSDIRKKDEIGIINHLDKKKIIFVNIGYKIISQWVYPYSVGRTSSLDENFMTSSQVKDVLQLMNLVLGTNIYYDFSKYD